MIILVPVLTTNIVWGDNRPNSPKVLQISCEMENINFLLWLLENSKYLSPKEAKIAQLLTFIQENISNLNDQSSPCKLSRI